MRALLAVVLLLGSFAGWAQPASAVRRFAVVVGVNDGGPDRLRLRYAVSDAEAFGQVLEQLGGVAPEDEVRVLEGDQDALLRAIDTVRERAAAASRPGLRVEVVFYYSGHSDQDGLRIRGGLLRYADLRAALAKIGADVRIAVLDSCASGAMSRAKGGQFRPAFLLDASTQVRGTAILTSSSATEVSQESDRLGGSFFTHRLVSGLRGAADLSHDGRVTLTEAYQFAFGETLARTENTLGGAQHPTYELELVGTGDLVITDVRSSAAGLVLPAELEGRLFVRDERGELVVEVDKQLGTTVDLGLPAGRYRVRREISSVAEVELHDGARRILRPTELKPSVPEPTASRGSQTRLLHLSLLPSGRAEDPAGTELALGLVTRIGAVDGAALALLGTWVDRDARWLMGTLGVNEVKGMVTGFQVAGMYNRAGAGMRGLQFTAGINRTGGVLEGAQLGGLANWAEAGGTGAQFGAGLNVSRAALTGAQLGTLNLASELTGVQFGLVNVVGKGRGVQFGVLNLSDDVEGASIGLLTLSRHGQLHGELFASDLEPVNLALKLGGRRTYSVITAGTGRDRTLTYGYALGATVGPGPWWVDVDLGATSLHTYAQPLLFSNLVGQLRAIAGFRLGNTLGLFAGPTVNALIVFRSGGPERATYVPDSVSVAAGNVDLWPGLQVGLRI